MSSLWFFCFVSPLRAKTRRRWRSWKSLGLRQAVEAQNKELARKLSRLPSTGTISAMLEELSCRRLLRSSAPGSARASETVKMLSFELINAASIAAFPGLAACD